MMEIKDIKDKVSKLYNEKKEIHISINSQKKKLKMRHVSLMVFITIFLLLNLWLIGIKNLLQFYM